MNTQTDLTFTPVGIKGMEDLEEGFCIRPDRITRIHVQRKYHSIYTETYLRERAYEELCICPSTFARTDFLGRSLNDGLHFDPDFGSPTAYERAQARTWRTGSAVPVLLSPNDRRFSS